MSNRPYKDLTRAAIAVASNDQERSRIMKLVKENPPASIAMALHQQRSEIAQDVQALNLELHIRNTPDLIREFGPGAD
jgi:glutamine synthetase type III